MLIQDYGDYLRNKVSKTSIGIYRRKLKDFLENGYSEADLCGAVNVLIKGYSKGGERYDAKDHGNTVAALKKLRNMINEPYANDFFIKYKKGFSSFVSVGDFVSEYEICDFSINIVYDRGFSSKVKTVAKKIPDNDYFELIDIFRRYEDCLSSSNTAIGTFHGSICEYDYNFNGKHEVNCNSLFEDNKTCACATSANEEFVNWLKKYIKR